MLPKTGITGTGPSGNVMVVGGSTTPCAVEGTSAAAGASARPVGVATGESMAAAGVAVEMVS